MARNEHIDTTVSNTDNIVESKRPSMQERQKEVYGEVGKTETFFTRNVKLITFLICVAVILSPFVVTYIRDVVEARREAELPRMTVDELVYIADIGGDLRQRNLSKYEDYREEIDMQGMKYASYRIPVLHEKELVLNAQDTENLLATVSILRELTKAIDLNATWASMGIGSLNAVGVNENKNILEQQVEIHAEFPNATDRHEIEEAFSTLINRASQYANRF